MRVLVSTWVPERVSTRSARKLRSSLIRPSTVSRYSGVVDGERRVVEDHKLAWCALFRSEAFLEKQERLAGVALAAALDIGIRSDPSQNCDGKHRRRGDSAEYEPTVTIRPATQPRREEALLGWRYLQSTKPPSLTSGNTGTSLPFCT